jgi:hypothetical protein
MLLTGGGTVGEVRINIQGTVSSNDDFVVDYNSLNEYDLLQLLKRGSVDMFLITADGRSHDQFRVNSVIQLTF